MTDEALRSPASRFSLNQGPGIPCLGLGVYQTEPGRETRHAVATALRLGYRHIDTATLYRNEADVGAAVRDSGLPRDEVFVTTKMWHTAHGLESSQQAARESQARLGLGPIDLYLIHWPTTASPENRLATWKGFERLVRDGVVRAVGVSNYARHHLEPLLASTDLVPAVDQVEMHPFVYDPAFERYCRDRSIRLAAYAPLTRGQRLDDPTLAQVAADHGKSPAQVLVRWGLDHGIVELPKSVHEERIRENADVFDFALTPSELERLDALRDGRRQIGSDPARIP